MQDRPTAAEAIDAVTELLRDDVLPAARAEHRFQLRVAVNLLGILERELRDGPALNAAELERLRALLGHDGELAELNRELADRLRRGEIGWRFPALLAHLRQTAEDRVRIANPRYLTGPT